MLGVLDGDGNPDDPSPVDRESSKVQTVVALFPATDFIEGIKGGGRGPALFDARLGRRQLGNNPNSAEERFSGVTLMLFPVSYSLFPIP